MPTAGRCLLDEFGTDVIAMMIHPPASPTDYMGYCAWPQWTSKYTYEALGRLRPRGRAIDERLGVSIAQDEIVEAAFLEGHVSPSEVRVNGGTYAAPAPAGRSQIPGARTARLVAPTAPS
jgi:hypothetical protein